MPIEALKHIESLKKPKKPVKTEPKRVVADVVERPETEEHAATQIVRTPRVITSKLQPRVDKLSEGEAIIDDGKLGVTIETQARRRDVTAWMLNGHVFDDELCDMQMLADKLGVPVKTVGMDVKAIKDKMAEFYTQEDDTRDIAALAHMLLEMKFRDRGLALKLYNQVLRDINECDARVAERKKNKQFSKMDGFGQLSGRDRAAMYSTALAAIDLANRTTNGMESLLKLTGGAAKLTLIIKAKQAFIANKGVKIDNLTIQGMVQDMMGGVLPSNREQNKAPVPSFLALDDEDRAVLAIESRSSRKPKVVLNGKS